ncbi:low-density lipoprotein receptor-related protein 11 [Orussus abietinus]|uniref:low-density lipoprotein receptor-related protein 11 n=1 Tax=Orussus abietinus TaxID=222816 RepID=UPI000625C065|nr:low-density lipoprotein receptor-related protein 11 [Orussus abietinus]
MQLCIENFDIHKDKIIKTEDSRELGAKYLNEQDVKSRDDCLRFCCETDHCDVFIFEEKRPGSCYLFHCGPPDDFKCKFTNHDNYSSALLTVNLNALNTARLEEQIQRTRQEHELESLRKLADSAPVEYSFSELPATMMTQTPKAPTLTTPLPTKSKCSRNQYECRTSGDCIAIYNACDGIPQCPDGSDEAADLGCPTEKPTVPPASPVHQPYILVPSDVPKHQQVMHRKPYAPVNIRGQERDQESWQASAPNRPSISQQNLQYPVQQVAIPQQPVSFGSQGYPWEFQPLYDQNKEVYGNPIGSYRGPNGLPPYEQQPSIFSHKGASIVGKPLPEGVNGYIDSGRQYHPFYSPPNHETWQEGQLQSVPSVTPKVQHNQRIVAQEKDATTSPPPCKPPAKELESLPRNEGDKKNIKNSKGDSVKIDTLSNKAVATKNERQKESHPKVTEPHEHENHSEISEDYPKVIEKPHIVAEHLRQKGGDNKLMRPTGAIISLALGLTATAIMAALIACRLRVVRRRGRRGHGPYAHDADYLVNGMYL